MRTVNIRALLTALGGDVPVDRATVTMQYWAGSGPFVRVQGADITFPPVMVVHLVEGDPEETVQLEETGDVCCVRFTARYGRFSMPDRFKAIPAGTGAVDFDDLPDVDPATFAPATPTPTLLQTIQAAITDATFDRF